MASETIAIGGGAPRLDDRGRYDGRGYAGGDPAFRPLPGQRFDSGRGGGDGRRDGWRQPGGGGPGFDRGGGWGSRGFAYRDGWRQDRRYDWRDYRDGHRQQFRAPRYLPPRGYGYGYRPFGIGMRIDRGLYASTYWIGDPYAYRLPPATGPYRWVRYYQDVLLIDLRSGQVVDVIDGFFL